MPLAAMNASDRILIAGCGDVGLRAARLLASRGAQVWGLRRSLPPGPAPLSWIAADLRQPATLAALPPGITHLAYLPTPGARSPEAYRGVFIDGLRNLMAALDPATLRRVVLVSSTAVYGEHEGAWVDELTPTGPLSFNGDILCEAEAWLAAQPVPSVSLRLAGLYGPGRLQLIARLREGRARAPRHPVHWANRMHVDDAAGALAHLLSLPDPAPVYLGCDDTPLPLHELYAALAEMAGAPAPGEGPAPGAVGSKRLSNARLRASGYALRWPDARQGYAALLKDA
ncbi:Nucleoside-diphosphate-sugar epimerases [plant metagenome]|uniref:Nucleoside-diphosphate-sugar epimerases n=1 Tax=plant metagenome TaxID=1297885 RepID=A0A484NXE1_9ZZZZ